MTVRKPLPIQKRYDPIKKEYYDVSLCHWCYFAIDWRTGDWYQDSFGRWEFCGRCYARTPHPAGHTLAWWYAVERLAEINRTSELLGAP